jgi:hypothetical protein
MRTRGASLAAALANLALGLAVAPSLTACGGRSLEIEPGPADAASNEDAATADDAAPPQDGSTSCGLTIAGGQQTPYACETVTLSVTGWNPYCGEGSITGELCAQLCAPATNDYCFLDATHTQLTCSGNCYTGRRPEGLEPREASAATLGEFLASAAHLELASVVAFDRMARELAAHGAPRALRQRARRSRREEVRHGRAMSRLARRAGGRVKAPEVAPVAVRSLVEIAIENAVEGCVRETFGAAVAAVSAARAEDPAARPVLGRIARDEAAHAELSWELARWLEPRLTPAERKRVRAARDRALEELAVEVSVEPRAEIARWLGAPSAAAATAMVRELGRRIAA